MGVSQRHSVAYLPFVSLLLLATLTVGAANAETGSAACAVCHAGIFARYMRTPMALSSGRTGSGSFAESFEKAEIAHAPSGVRYRVYPDQNKPSFDFDLSDVNLRIQGSR